MDRRDREASAAPPATPEMLAAREFGVTKVSQGFLGSPEHPENPAWTAYTETLA